MRKIERGLREVRERFLERLDERLDRIRQAAARLPVDPDARPTLGREIHSLIGAAGLLGFHDLASAAQAVDRTLADGEGAASPALADGLARLDACGAAYARPRTVA